MTEEPTAELDPQDEWWDDPGMPWRRKPTKSDLWCMGWMGVAAIFGLIMLPLRGWLLGLNPPLLLAITGSRTAAASLGALFSQGLAQNLWLPIVLGTIMSVKFDWIYWWAGKLWGRGMIEVWAGQSRRAAKNYARVERWAVKWGALGIFLAYAPIPLPLMAVVFVLAGASGMSIKKFMILDVIASVSWTLLFVTLGYGIGEPAVMLLREYARISNYVAIGLVVFVFVSYQMGASKKARAKVASLSNGHVQEQSDANGLVDSGEAAPASTDELRKNSDTLQTGSVDDLESFVDPL